MISPTGESLTFSTYLEENWIDATDSIAVDNSGWVYVAGTATSENFPQDCSDRYFTGHLYILGPVFG